MGDLAGVGGVVQDEVIGQVLIRGDLGHHGNLVGASVWTQEVNGVADGVT